MGTKLAGAFIAPTAYCLLPTVVVGELCKKKLLEPEEVDVE
jgi:hypothetical protein